MQDLKNKIYFNGSDGNPIVKGDRCRWSLGNDETVWIIAGEPCGMSMYDGYHPNSDYMTVWAKPESETSNSWTNKWVCRKTKGFIKI